MSVRFDNNADLLKRTTGTLTSSSANLSACCWVKRKVDTGAFATALYLHNSVQAHELWLETDTGGDQMFFYDLRVTEADLAGPTLTVDTWFFVGFTRTNTARTLYWGTESGGSLSTTTDSTTLNSTTGGIAEWWIAQDIYTEGFNGEIVWVRIWDAAISSGDMDAEWRSATAVRTSNLRAEYRLPDSANATTDSSGNGFTLTSGGTLADGGANPTPPSSGIPPGLGPDLSMEPSSQAANVLGRF